MERMEVGLSSPVGDEGGRQKKGAGSVLWVGTGQGHSRKRVKTAKKSGSRSGGS